MDEAMNIEEIYDTDDSEINEFSSDDYSEKILDELSDIDADEELENYLSSVDIAGQGQIESLKEYKEQLLDYKDAMKRRQDIDELYLLKDELLELRDIEDDSEDEQKVLKLW